MSTSQPVVAVLVATANRTHYLKSRTLVSVGSQTRPPVRLVVVDDSDAENTDQTRRLVEGWHFPSVNVDFLRNRRTKGAAGAWNSGLDHLLRTSNVSPDQIYVAILDDDDEWLPHHLESCSATIGGRRSRSGRDAFLADRRVRGPRTGRAADVARRGGLPSGESGESRAAT